MSAPHGDVRDVREDSGSFSWPDSTPTALRTDAPPPGAPLKDDELGGAITTPNVPRWWSFRTSAADDPRRMSAYFEHGRATKGPRPILGAQIHDAAGAAGVHAMPHARGRIPVTARAHPDYAEAKAPVKPLSREQTAYAMYHALDRLGAHKAAHVGPKKPSDRPERPGSGEIDLAPATSVGATSGVQAGATAAVMETTGSVESGGAHARWSTYTHTSRPGDTRHVHAYADHEGLVTKGPEHLLGARADHLAAVEDEGLTTVHHPRGRRPQGHDRQKDYTEATTHRVRPLSRDGAGLGLLRSFITAAPCAYNKPVDTEPDADDTPAATTTSAPVAESAPTQTRRAGYTAPAPAERARGDTAPVRETTGAVVGPAWRQYRSAGAGVGRAKTTAYEMPDYRAYATRGVAIAARESDVDVRLQAVALSGCPSSADAGEGTDARRVGGRALGAVQGIGQDDALAARVQEQLAAWQPAHLVAVLATPADLLVCEAAWGLHLGLGLVLVESEPWVRARLVAARGEAWGGRFDRLLAHVCDSGGSVFQRIGPDAAAGRCLNEALAVARQNVGIGQQPAGFVRAFIVSDGAGGPPIARDLARSALVAGCEVTTITVAGFGGGGVL